MSSQDDTDSSDDEFSLQDIGGRKVVGDILDDEDDDENDDDAGLDGHHDAMFASDGDPYSVQVFDTSPKDKLFKGWILNLKLGHSGRVFAGYGAISIWFLSNV